MKKSVMAASVAALCAAGSATATTAPGAPADLNIRVVNTMQVMQDSAEGKQVVKEFEAERMKTTQALEAQQQTLMKEVQEYEAKKSTLAESAARKKRNELEEKEVAFKRKVSEAEAELREKMQERTEMVAQSVEKSLRAVAEEAKADLVFDEMTGRVVYARDDLKITDKAIKKMDVEYMARAEKGAAAHETKMASGKKDAKGKAAA